MCHSVSLEIDHHLSVFTLLLCLHLLKCSPDPFKKRPKLGRSPPRGVGPQQAEMEEVVAPPPAEASSDAG